jgi:hypothetical protein
LFATKKISSLTKGYANSIPFLPLQFKLLLSAQEEWLGNRARGWVGFNTLLSSGNPTILYNLYVCYRLEKTSSIACMLISICSRRINKTDRATGWAHSFIPALDIWSRSRITINQSTRPLNFTGHRCAAH